MTIYILYWRITIRENVFIYFLHLNICLSNIYTPFRHFTSSLQKFLIMIWLNSLRRNNERIITCWGYTFQLTDNHLTLEQAAPLKISYDRLGEQALHRLNIISPPPRSALPRNSNKFSEKGDVLGESGSSNGTLKRDLFTLLRDNADTDDVLGRLWLEVNTVPAWVDWSQIARGQEVFYRYGGPALTGLAYQSLLGGMVGSLVYKLYISTY